MPLPQHGSLSLHGPSRPGEGNAKPKQAMILRLSEDTLDALQNLAAGEGVEFDASDKPGIVIRNAFFPMTLLPESHPRELFIRTTSAVRPNGPLKLNANVVGRYVAQRDLSDKLKKQIHDSSVAAAKQKNGRQTIVLDTPPIAPVSKKKKSQAKSNSKASLLPPNRFNESRRPTSPLPMRPSTSASSSVSSSNKTTIISREKLIHFLALRPQSLQAILQFAAGANIDESVRRQIMELLREVAEEEPPPKKASNTVAASRIWRLKPTTWLDIRPREYPDYNEAERLAVARAARNWLVSMKVPENTPAWEHVAYRSNNSVAKATVPPVNKSAATSTKTNDAKNSIPAKEIAKRDLAKQKTEAGPSEIKARSSLPVKVESTKVEAGRSQDPLRSNVAKTVHKSDNEREDGEILATPPRTILARALPGSKSSLPQRPEISTPVPQASTNSTSTLKRRAGPVDARTMKKELPTPSGSANPAPPLPPPVPTQKKSISQPKSMKTEKQVDIQSSTTINATSSRNPEIRVKEEVKSRNSITGIKRKQRELDEEDSDWADIAGPAHVNESKSKKKRVSETSAVRPTQPAIKVERLPEENHKSSKPVIVKKEARLVSQTTKIKKGPTPVPSSRPQNSSSVPPNREEERATSRSTTSSTKLRRRSPIYTSSEEEEENKKLVSQTNGYNHSSKALPQDHASLRERYATAYVEYLSTFQQVVAQKNKIEKMLKGSGSSSGGVTDSEGDVDMMNAEELDRLTKKHRSLHEELEGITSAWNR